MKKKLKMIGISILIVILALFGMWKLINSRTFQLFGGITDKVETSQKVIALTFDDGPTKNVDDILALLDPRVRQSLGKQNASRPLIQ
ncbi:putative membrane protein, partial [Geobacillus sp. PA-3]|uniref:polysaccharide deacetylase family protein n=1 Tax=Geobacillus sp. PA-3 TaxID=1699078 RepID=UPI0006E6D6BE